MLHFIPGADGFFDCMTYQGPIRARVAWRVNALFSILQRGQGASVFSAMAPQNGQTDMMGAEGFCISGFRSVSLGMVSKDLVMSSIACWNPFSSNHLTTNNSKDR